MIFINMKIFQAYSEMFTNFDIDHDVIWSVKIFYQDMLIGKNYKNIFMFNLLYSDNLIYI